MAPAIQPQWQGWQQGTVRTVAKRTAHAPLKAALISQLRLIVAPEDDEAGIAIFEFFKRGQIFAFLL